MTISDRDAEDQEERKSQSAEDDRSAEDHGGRIRVDDEQPQRCKQVESSRSCVSRSSDLMLHGLFGETVAQAAPIDRAKADAIAERHTAQVEDDEQPWQPFHMERFGERSDPSYRNQSGKPAIATFSQMAMFC